MLESTIHIFLGNTTRIVKATIFFFFCYKTMNLMRTF